MVTSNQNPPAGGSTLGEMFAAGTAAAKHLGHDVEPRDDPAFVAQVALAAELTAADAARKTRCGCKCCLLALPQVAVMAWMCRETLRDAFTGDRSRLDQMAARVAGYAEADRGTPSG